MKRSRGPVWALILLALVLILLGILGEDWKSLLKFAGASTLLVLLALAFIWIWSGESRPQPPVRRRAGTDARSFHTRVVGVTFTNPDGAQRQGIIYECQVGEELLLIREPGNRFDPNAIKVCRASGERRTTLNGTSPGAETCRGADDLRSWKRRRTAAKAVAMMVPMCPMESVAPALMRSLTWWL